MKILVLTEIKNGETRVGMLPSGVEKLVQQGHIVVFEHNLGQKIGVPDSEYAKAGAVMAAPCHFAPGNDAELVVKVKEPLAEEFRLFSDGQAIFTYLHLAPNRELVDFLLGKRITGIDYGSICEPNGFMPLQWNMSYIAGRLAVQKGQQYLAIDEGGKGLLMGQGDDYPKVRVTIVGAGVVGTAAAETAMALGASVGIFDISDSKLSKLTQRLTEKFPGVIFYIQNLQRPSNLFAYIITRTDLLIGATLVPGVLAKKVVTREMVASMEPKSVVVDVSIDQGGCIETSRATSHSDPVYRWGDNEIIHYCVPNMPANVGRTATRALTSATLPFIEELANKGIEKALRENPLLAMGVNTFKGYVTHRGLAESQGREYVPIKKLL